MNKKILFFAMLFLAFLIASIAMAYDISSGNQSLKEQIKADLSATEPWETDGEADVVEKEEKETIIIDDESDDTEGIIILNPGETELEELEKYIISKRKVVHSQEKRNEVDYSEEDSDITIDYESDDNASIILVDADGSSKRENTGYIVVERAGFLSKSFKKDGYIKSVSKKMLLKQTDEIYIQMTVGRGVKPGNTFIIYNDEEEVYNPVDDVFMGRHIDIVGVAQILKKISKKEGLYLATVLKSYEFAKDGYKVKMRKDVKDYSKKINRKIRKKKNDVQAYIIKALHGKTILVNKDIVYLDKGMAAGLLPGEKMTIIRQTENETEEEPDNYHEVGTLLIINSMRDTSVGMIIEQKEIIKVGYSVETLKE